MENPSSNYIGGVGGNGSGTAINGSTGNHTEYILILFSLGFNGLTGGCGFENNALQSGEGNIISVLLEDSKLFRIENKQFEFSDQDPIFFLEKPTAKKEYLAEKGLCSCCSSGFKSVKSVNYWYEISK